MRKFSLFTESNKKNEQKSETKIENANSRVYFGNMREYDDDDDIIYTDKNKNN